jgi:hypothetical protein
MTEEFHIQDWTGRVLFGGRTFPSFEDAWGFVYETDPNTEEDEHHYDDYYVYVAGPYWIEHDDAETGEPLEGHWHNSEGQDVDAAGNLL